MERVQTLEVEMVEAEESTSPKGHVCIIHGGLEMPQMLLGDGLQHAGGSQLQIPTIFVSTRSDWGVYE